MEPLDDRSKDLVVDLLLLACAKAASARPGTMAARPGTREALRAHDSTFKPDGAIDLTGAWELLQQVGGISADDATDACAFLKTLEPRLGVELRAPEAAAGPARAKLVGDAEVERFFTAAAIRPQPSGTRSFPGITSHLVAGHAVGARRASGKISAQPSVVATPAKPKSEEHAAVSKLDALYETGEVSSLGASRTPSGGQGRLTGSAAALRTSGKVPALVRTPEQDAARVRRQRILAVGLSVLAVVLVVVVLVPSLQDDSVPPQVLEPTVVAPLRVKDLKVLGPDAHATLVDEVSWLSEPLPQRQRELEGALVLLRPYKVARLTVLSSDHVVASAHSTGGRIVVRFGR